MGDYRQTPQGKALLFLAPQLMHREDMPRPHIILMWPLQRHTCKCSADVPTWDVALRDPNFTVRSVMQKLWQPWTQKDLWPDPYVLRLG